jgi:hypothetical protein
MTTTQPAQLLDADTAERLAEQLADVFRTGTVGDILADDLFLDGHPPYWRFQVDGLDAFTEWLRSYAPDGREVEVVRTLPTATGFLIEQTSVDHRDGEEITGRELVICTVRAGRISELLVYCSGEWDAELRARHAAEAPIFRP